MSKVTYRDLCLSALLDELLTQDFGQGENNVFIIFFPNTCKII